MDCSGPLCWAFLGFSSVKLTPLEEKETDWKSIDAIWDTRKSDAKASKTAVLWDNFDSGKELFSQRDATYTTTLGSQDEFLGSGGFILKHPLRSPLTSGCEPMGWPSKCGSVFYSIDRCTLIVLYDFPAPCKLVRNFSTKSRVVDKGSSPRW